MKSPRIDRRTLWIGIALVAVPVLLVALLYPLLPTLIVPRLGLNGAYDRIVPKPVYFLLALIPVFVYFRLKK